MPEPQNRELSVAIPSNLVAELSHLREKTSVIGQISRASAIFRVNHIYLYKDSPDESKLIRQIMQYMETPQYLRKQLFPHQPELRYAGVLPPLRTPHHSVETNKNLISIGDYREGYSLNKNGEIFADVGLSSLLKIYGSSPSINSRVTVKITNTSPLSGVIIRKNEIKKYWGYAVHVINNLNQLLGTGLFDLTLATSKNGAQYIDNKKYLLKKWGMSEKVLIAFGTPQRGLNEVLGEDTINNFFDFYLNLIPEQGTKTVRTNEAYMACLAIINLLN
jgi:predicted SPOUT superfamily RNA methylase MTH1